MTRTLPCLPQPLLVAASALAVVGLLGCPTDPALPHEPAAPGDVFRSALTFDANPDIDAADLLAHAQGHYALAGDLLAQLDGNASLSPLSISAAFSMLSAGAEGQTLSELEDGLSLLPQEKLHRAQNAIELALRDRNLPATDEHGGVLLTQANQLFGAVGFTPEDAFLDILAERYDAGLHVLDFNGATEESRAAINEWVAERTHDMIPELLGPNSVSPNTRLALVNALYLNAAWASPFEETFTAPRPFTLESGASVDVPTMSGGVAGRVGQQGDVQLVEIPFVGEELVLAIAVPRAGASHDDALLALATAERSDAFVQLTLPKFEVRSKLNLKDALVSLGVVAPFDADTCDLSGIHRAESLYVGAAVHEAVVEVDENGATAAAATAILVVGRGASEPEDVIEVNVDEPFSFAIIDRTTDMPLFVGRVVDPR